MILAVDTSTRFAGVALLEGGRIIGSSSWYSNHNHTAELASAIKKILEQAQKNLRDITQLVVALGPGGFSALKVGMSMTKGMALGLGIPVIGVSTLETEAYAFVNSNMRICPLIGIGRREYACAIYIGEQGNLKLEREPFVIDLEGISSLSEGNAFICGEGAEEVSNTLFEDMKMHPGFLNYYPPSLRVESLAYIGWMRRCEFNEEDIITMQPFYLRRPTIGKMKKKRMVSR